VLREVSSWSDMGSVFALLFYRSYPRSSIVSIDVRVSLIPEYLLVDILQIAFDSKAGRNERPPRVGVNLFDVLAQVFPVQLFGLRS